MVSASKDMIWRMINAAICAYQIHPDGWKIPAGYTGKPTDLFTPVPGKDGRYVYDRYGRFQDQVGFPKTADEGYNPLFASTGVDDINAALVGPMVDGNIVVAIRGTIPPNDIFDDARFWLHDWSEDFIMGPRDWPMVEGPSGLRPEVETGFADALFGEQKYGILWQNIIDMIEATAKQNKCTGVVITGHSKGAAMTFLLATLIEKTFPQYKGNISVYAFAAPVVGNLGFQEAYDALNIPTHRFQAEHDLVPFLPLWVGESIYPKVRFPGFFAFWKRFLWNRLARHVRRKTDGGYYAVGDMTYLHNGTIPPGQTDADAALDAVAALIVKGEFGEVAAAHSAVNSYLAHLPRPLNPRPKG